MKKTLLIAFVAVLSLGACSKTYIPQNDEHPIAFATYSPKSVDQATKAAAGSVLSGTNFAANATINVYSWNSGNSAFAQSAVVPNYMKNDGSATASVVTLSSNPGTTPSSNYTPLKFWPSDEDNNLLSFIGFYPAGASAGYTLKWTDAANVVTGAITVPAATAKQIDFMASDIVNDQKYSATTPAGNVQLNFHHLMSQVKVLVKTDAATDEILSGASAPVLTVSSVRFLSIKNQGALTTTYATGATTHTMAETGATTETYVFSPESPLDLVGTSTKAKFLPSCQETATADDAFMLVPQDLVAEAQQAEITYKVTYSDGTENETTKIVDLADGTVKTWGQNKKINYTFVIGLHPITFTTSLCDWDDVTPDPFNF